jgi:GNAT superfamily N-acetyltransferase
MMKKEIITKMSEVLISKTRNFINTTDEGRVVIESPVGSLTLVITKIGEFKVLGFYMISIKRKYQGQGIGSKIISESMRWVDQGIIDGRASLNVISPIADGILSKYPVEKIKRFADIKLEYPSYIYTKNQKILCHLCD